MKELMEGLQGSEGMKVERQDLASFTGNIGAEVLSTHRVILLMEQACRNAIEGCLTEGKITVGTMIHIKHFAAVPLGGRVRAQALLRRVEGRRLLFEVVVYDDFEKVSEGEVERFVVSREAFLKKMGMKQELSRAIP